MNVSTNQKIAVIEIFAGLSIRTFDTKLDAAISLLQSYVSEKAAAGLGEGRGSFLKLWTLTSHQCLEAINQAFSDLVEQEFGTKNNEQEDSEPEEQ